MPETIYEFEMSNVGASYETPRITEWEKYKLDRELKSDEEAIEHLNNWGGQYFIGTQAEYDKLKTITETYHTANGDGGTLRFLGINHLQNGKVVFDDSQWLTSARWTEVNELHYFYYDLHGQALFKTWKWLDYLNGNKNGVAPKFSDIVTDTDAKELTKAEYDVLLAKNQVAQALANKVAQFKAISSPKLAAYILKCEEYVAIHNGAVKADALTTFIGTNGKLDIAKLETQIKANQDKRDSILVLGEVYLTWIKAIEDGTQASLDTLPDLTPDELNRTIDND